MESVLRNLIQTGNSKALILTKDMRDHLGVEDEVEVEFRRGSIVLRHPEVPDEDSEPTPKKVKAVKEKAAETSEPKPKDKVKEPKVKEAKLPKEVKVKAPKPAKLEKLKEKTKDKKSKKPK